MKRILGNGSGKLASIADFSDELKRPTRSVDVKMAKLFNSRARIDYGNLTSLALVDTRLL
jgi:hypothetical protein